MINHFTYSSDGIELNTQKTEKVNSFIAFIENSNNAEIIYRGENYENLKTKLNLDDFNDFKKLNDFIFLIGDKGRGYRIEFKKKIKNKSKIFPINCTDEKIFNYIFDKLNLILLNSDKPEVVDFKSNNPECANYFSDKKSYKSDFLEQTKLISIEKDKIRVRDYYLNLLHQIGFIGFYNNSFFVSATKDFETAKYFSGKLTKSERIVFISWLSYPYNRTEVNFNYLNGFKSKLGNIGLPTYSKSFFPKQHEVLLKGALLPHYIIGYLRLEKQIFELNPHFFTTTKTIKQIVQNGIDIDQTNFHSALKETDNSGFVMLDNFSDYSDYNF